MRVFLILLVCIASVTNAQQRSLPTSAAVPPPGSTGTVTLSLTEYNRLVELTTRKPKKTDAPPQPFVISRAAFKLKVEDQSVTGGVDISGSILNEGSIKVPLTTGLTVLEAHQGTKPLPLMQEGATHAGILTGPGPFAVSLNVASPLTIDAGRASFVVSVPAASSSVLTLDLPGSHANVRIEPGLITNRATLNGHTIIEATLEAGRPVRIFWTTREIAAPVAQREVRFLSDIKTMVSIEDSQLRVTALCDVTIIQGEATEFRIPLPSGFELTDASGTTLDSNETQAGVLILRVREPNRRNHQFLVSIERSNREAKVEAPLLSFTGAQRETGEVLVEGVGSMDLTPTESGGLRRMDVREAGAITRSLARFPLQAAFRYNRRSAETPKLELEWTLFPDSQVLSAIADRATITTLMNGEGKSLTEVTLKVRNHAQQYVKVDLPKGATLLSAEVGGERVKPVLGADGNRVPLMRTGFNPSGAYTVSFVYLNSEAPFAKSGSYEMGLPKLDIPVNVLTWEISLPDRLEVRQFAGNAMSADLFPAAAQSTFTNAEDDLSETDSNVFAQNSVDMDNLEAGYMGGVVADPNGAVVTNAQVTVVNKQTNQSLTTRTDGDGRWVISGMQPGPVRVSVTANGFKSVQQELELSSSHSAKLGTTLEVGTVSETVQVTNLNALTSGNFIVDGQVRKNQAAQVNAPSQNVFSLQRRVAGILPVRVEVPRAGKSYKFVRPLVMEEATNVTFQYKSR